MSDDTRRRIHLLADEARPSLVTPAGVQASSWTLFRGAVFGRDSAIVGLDMVEFDQALTRTIIESLVRCQGLRTDPLTYEEPGKIHHEYRARTLGGAPVDDGALAQMHQLATTMGLPTSDEFITYLSVDATPLFVRLVSSYCDRYGPAILDESFWHRSGTWLSVRESVTLALEWIAHTVAQSPLGLVEARPNRWGCWQVLRDGAVAYVHSTGALANHRHLLAMLEVQGHAYDALRAGVRLLPESAVRWRSLARELQSNTLNQFWDSERQHFDVAIDRTPDGQLRRVTTAGSAVGDVLDTDLLWDVPGEWSTRELVRSIVAQLMGDDFLTDVGIRMRGRQHANLLPAADYQGSLVSWPVITNLFSRGLRRYGLPTLAQEVERRLLAGVLYTSEFVEFHYVSYDGAVHPRPHLPLDRRPGTPVVRGTNLPERTQAWTWSAALRSANALCGLQEITPWQQVLSRDYFPEPTVLTLKPWEIGIDLEAGKRWEQEFVAQATTVA